MTSCGLNGGPLIGKGEYPAYIACNLFCKHESIYTAAEGLWMDARFPKITQDGKDGDEEAGYILNMRDSATAGFKYFDCRGIEKVSIKVRGYCSGHFEIKTSWDGEPLGTIPIGFSNIWQEYTADISIPDGVHALYFTYRGHGSAALKSFTLI
jgi:arabinoxylan arabinofuranohydrolase